MLSIEDEYGDEPGADAVGLRRLHIKVLGQQPQLAGLDNLVAHLQERPEVRLATLDRERPE